MILENFQLTPDTFSNSWNSFGFGDLQSSVATGKSGRGFQLEESSWGYGHINESSSIRKVNAAIPNVSEHVEEHSASEGKDKYSIGQNEHSTGYRKEKSVQKKLFEEGPSAFVEDSSSTKKVKKRFNSQLDMEERLSGINTHLEEKYFDSSKARTERGSTGSKSESFYYLKNQYSDSFEKTNALNTKTLSESSDSSQFTLAALQQEFFSLKEKERELNTQIFNLLKSQKATEANRNSNDTNAVNRSDSPSLDRAPTLSDRQKSLSMKAASVPVKTSFENDVQRADSADTLSVNSKKTSVDGHPPHKASSTESVNFNTEARKQDLPTSKNLSEAEFKTSQKLNEKELVEKFEVSFFERLKKHLPSAVVPQLKNYFDKLQSLEQLDLDFVLKVSLGEEYTKQLENEALRKADNSLKKPRAEVESEFVRDLQDIVRDLYTKDFEKSGGSTDKQVDLELRSKLKTESKNRLEYLKSLFQKLNRAPADSVEGNVDFTHSTETSKSTETSPSFSHLSDKEDIGLVQAGSNNSPETPKLTEKNSIFKYFSNFLENDVVNEGPENPSLSMKLIDELEQLKAQLKTVDKDSTKEMDKSLFEAPPIRSFFEKNIGKDEFKNLVKEVPSHAVNDATLDELIVQLKSSRDRTESEKNKLLKTDKKLLSYLELTQTAATEYLENTKSYPLSASYIRNNLSEFSQSEDLQQNHHESYGESQAVPQQALHQKKSDKLVLEQLQGKSRNLNSQTKQSLGLVSQDRQSSPVPAAVQLQQKLNMRRSSSSDKTDKSQSSIKIKVGRISYRPSIANNGGVRNSRPKPKMTLADYNAKVGGGSE